MNRRRRVVLISLPQRGDVRVMRTHIRSQSGFLKLVQTQHNFLRLDTRPAQYSYTHYVHHAPARLRIDANLFDLARGYAAVWLLRPLRPAKGATGAGCEVRLGVWGCRNTTSTNISISK